MSAGFDNGSRLMVCIIAGLFIYLLLFNNSSKVVSGGSQNADAKDSVDNSKPPQTVSVEPVESKMNNNNDAQQPAPVSVEPNNRDDVMATYPTQNTDMVQTTPQQTPQDNNVSNAQSDGEAGYNITGSNSDKSYAEINKNDNLGMQDPSDISKSITEKEITRLLPDDLLPKFSDDNSWAELQNNADDANNLLDAGHHFGINTVGTSLRNANYSLRSEYPNPRVQVSPWQQSTIEPDTFRKALEIGCDDTPSE